MSTQPEALRLAERLESKYDPVLSFIKPAAAELRRLHEVNQELVAALKRVLTYQTNCPLTVVNQGVAALAKAQGESND